MLLLLLFPPGSHLGSEKLVEAILLPTFTGGETKQSRRSAHTFNETHVADAVGHWPAVVTTTWSAVKTLYTVNRVKKGQCVCVYGIASSLVCKTFIKIG